MCCLQPVAVHFMIGRWHTRRSAELPNGGWSIVGRASARSFVRGWLLIPHLLLPGPDLDQQLRDGLIQYRRAFESGDGCCHDIGNAAEKIDIAPVIGLPRVVAGAENAIRPTMVALDGHMQRREKSTPGL